MGSIRKRAKEIIAKAAEEANKGKSSPVPPAIPESPQQKARKQHTIILGMIEELAKIEESGSFRAFIKSINNQYANGGVVKK
jgi:thioredoxin-like negative regulator of GroEL